MGWTRIHRTVNANGGVSVRTGHSKETVALKNWSGLGDQGNVYTSPIDIPIKGDILVMIKFSQEIGDCWIRIEHSEDGATWYSDAQHTTAAKSSIDHAIGDDISRIHFIDASAVGDNYFFLYDIETHGMAKYTRFAITDTGTDESGQTAEFTLLPHNF